MEFGPLAVGIERPGVLRIDQPRILLPDQLPHHCEHVDLTLVEKYFGVLLVRYAHAHVAIVNVVNAVEVVTGNISIAISRKVIVLLALAVPQVIEP